MRDVRVGDVVSLDEEAGYLLGVVADRLQGEVDETFRRDRIWRKPQADRGVRGDELLAGRIGPVQ